MTSTCEICSKPKGCTCLLTQLKTMIDINIGLTNRFIDGSRAAFVLEGASETGSSARMYVDYDAILVARPESLTTVMVFHCSLAFFGGLEDYFNAAQPIREMITLRHQFVAKKPWTALVSDPNRITLRSHIANMRSLKGVATWRKGTDWFVVAPGYLDQFWSIFCSKL